MASALTNVTVIIKENAAFLQATDKKYMLTCIPASASPVSSDGAKDVKNDFNADPSGKRMGDNAMITVDFGGVTVENTHTTTVLHQIWYYILLSLSKGQI